MKRMHLLLDPAFQWQCVAANITDDAMLQHNNIRQMIQKAAQQKSVRNF